jgi:hypothetical protein
MLALSWGMVMKQYSPWWAVLQYKIEGIDLDICNQIVIKAKQY